ncbi:hypothetical protein Afil01_22710 [Actinorhabdospora filicis]|uniref:Uncharacterized protein n=1 Tax=Actinorhabdospora filicis TaxID=1785913 RepID=A0A9W6W8C8_9ACTN|nr:hypothetical protein [Actinorhabdospora filicis]GLZ77464.1 hypothetical protein Afil01_22710 [Actinorhabdospora filicis]
MRPNQHTRGGGLTAGLISVVVVGLVGSGFLALCALMADWHFMGGGTSPEMRAAETTNKRVLGTTALIWFYSAAGLAIVLACAGRRRAWIWPLVLTMATCSCGLAVPVGRDVNHKVTLAVELLFPKPAWQPRPEEEQPVGCFGDSPADAGNPRCKGG